MIRRINPKALALAHGEHNAIQALREKLYRRFPVVVPANGKIYEGIANPHWLPAFARAKMDAKAPINLPVTVDKDGTIKLHLGKVKPDRIRQFLDSNAHTAILRGNRLIIERDDKTKKFDRSRKKC